MRLRRRLTITGHSGERYIHVDAQLLASALVDDDRGVEVDLAIVDELHSREGENNCRRENSH